MRNAVKMSPESTFSIVPLDHFLYYSMYYDFHLRMPTYGPTSGKYQYYRLILENVKKVE